MNKKIVKSIFCRLFADFKFSTKLEDFYDLDFGGKLTNTLITLTMNPMVYIRR